MREKKEQTINVVVFCRLWVGVKCFIGSTDGPLAIAPPAPGQIIVCSSPLTRTQCTNQHHYHKYCKEKQEMLFWQLAKGTNCSA